MCEKRRVLRLLEALGSTPDEVAENLAAGGYVGYPEKATICPVANYLDRNGAREVSVAGGVASYRGRGQFVAQEVPLPDPVRTFARQFDLGRYPTLDARLHGHVHRR